MPFFENIFVIISYCVFGVQCWLGLVWLCVSGSTVVAFVTFDLPTES